MKSRKNKEQKIRRKLKLNKWKKTKISNDKNLKKIINEGKRKVEKTKNSDQKFRKIKHEKYNTISPLFSSKRSWPFSSTTIGDVCF